MGQPGVTAIEGWRQRRRPRCLAFLLAAAVLDTSTLQSACADQATGGSPWPEGRAVGGPSLSPRKPSQGLGGIPQCPTARGGASCRGCAACRPVRILRGWDGRRAGVLRGGGSSEEKTIGPLSHLKKSGQVNAMASSWGSVVAMPDEVPARHPRIPPTSLRCFASSLCALLICA